MIIITFDRLPASSLGCYGGFAVETPTWDLLAAQGIVLDHCYACEPIAPLATSEVTGLRMEIDAGDATTLSSGLKRLNRRLKELDDGTLWCRVQWGTTEAREMESQSVAVRLQQHFDRVAKLDEAFSQMIDLVAEFAPDQVLIATAAAGESLAFRSEHPAWLGSVGEELTHIPFVAVLPDVGALRCSALVGRTDLRTLIGELSTHRDSEAANVISGWLAAVHRTQFLLLESADALAIRTPEWLAVRPRAAADHENPVQLFSLPEDRWLQLNVASQSLGVVEDLSRLANWA